jgi:hypothetical protein
LSFDPGTTFYHKSARTHGKIQFFPKSLGNLWVRPRNIYPYNDFDINLDGYFQFHTVPRIILVHIYFARVYYKVFEMILQDISMVPRNIYMSINSCPRILLYYSILYIYYVPIYPYTSKKRPFLLLARAQRRARA